MADKNKKFKPKDRQEYLKAKIRKYGKNWKEHISSGDPGEWKEKPTPDATFGGKRIKKQGPEIKPFKIKQEPLAKNIRPKGLGHKAGGRAGFQHGGRTNLLEELGRVEGESSNRNRRAEVSRIHGELNKGYKSGGAVLKGKKVGIQIK